jgi:hypothetical protein
MDKKAATHVVAFLLSVGGFKMASNDLNARSAVNCSRGGTRGSDTINNLSGLATGYKGSKPLNRLPREVVTAKGSCNGYSSITWSHHQFLPSLKRSGFTSSLMVLTFRTTFAWLFIAITM